MNINIDFDDLKERALDLAQSGVAKALELTDTGVAKAKELAEISKLKVLNLREQDAIRRAYMDLGRLYYAERGSAPEAAYSDLCDKITRSKAQIQVNEQRIADLKTSGNLTDEEVEQACPTDFEDADWEFVDQTLAHEASVAQEEPVQEEATAEVSEEKTDAE
ncbi:hypothetical protein [Pseudoflavonifractor sp. An85]|uniref:hypothetical protein n=1 Tax=Pseudoflavonifractor sp. An85 TaxID=1965661 RepID=UPI000B3A772E|nr:hypothetical protein [Pseudoflavonifractor sp. An85]OUN22752.1 hypothetical protein B5G37_09435 [Pseudoflavonifractor sp. An85]